MLTTDSCRSAGTDLILETESEVHFTPTRQPSASAWLERLAPSSKGLTRHRVLNPWEGGKLAETCGLSWEKRSACSWYSTAKKQNSPMWGAQSLECSLSLSLWLNFCHKSATMEHRLVNRYAPWSVNGSDLNEFSPAERSEPLSLSLSLSRSLSPSGNVSVVRLRYTSRCPNRLYCTLSAGVTTMD